MGGGGGHCWCQEDTGTSGSSCLVESGCSVRTCAHVISACAEGCPGCPWSGFSDSGRSCGIPRHMGVVGTALVTGPQRVSWEGPGSQGEQPPAGRRGEGDALCSPPASGLSAARARASRPLGPWRGLLGTHSAVAACGAPGSCRQPGSVLRLSFRWTLGRLRSGQTTCNPPQVVSSVPAAKTQHKGQQRRGAGERPGHHSREKGP